MHANSSSFQVSRRNVAVLAVLRSPCLTTAVASVFDPSKYSACSHASLPRCIPSVEVFESVFLGLKGECNVA